jgi:hypothetical protein
VTGASDAAAGAIPARYEHKYVVPEELVPALRGAIRPYCELDPHGAAAPGGRYVIRSLYLDTWSRDLYRLAVDGRPSRLKLRVRVYGAADGPERGSVFLEVKRKERGLVLKARARVPAAGWVERLLGPAPADAGPAERRFRDELAGRGLRPTLLVRYEREAWVGTVERYARVTFDGRIACAPAPEWSLAAPPAAWRAMDDRATLRGPPRATVLELKCERDVPGWMCRLVERFGLRKVGVSKYCRGVERTWMPDRLLLDRAPLREGWNHG